MYYRSYTIWHVIQFQNDSSHFPVTVRQEIKLCYMPNRPIYKIHTKIPPTFLGMLGGGGDGKMTQENFYNFF